MPCSSATTASARRGAAFAPVAPLTGLPLILAVHPSLGVSSVDELIALAKSKPGELTYGSVGPGTVGHLAMELISVRTNIKLVHVPYPGSPPQVTDLVAGRLSMVLAVASTVMPHVEVGRLTALASCSARRARRAPNRAFSTRPRPCAPSARQPWA